MLCHADVHDSKGLPTDGWYHPLIDAISPAMADSTIENLYTVSSTLLSQCLDLLQGLSHAQLTAEARCLPGSTVGKHLRHMSDHYALLCTASAAQSSHSDAQLELNYDSRSRNVQHECSVDAAQIMIQEIKAKLRQECSRRLNKDTQVQLQAVTPFEVTTTSSWGREVRNSFASDVCSAQLKPVLP